MQRSTTRQLPRIADLGSSLESAEREIVESGYAIRLGPYADRARTDDVIVFHRDILFARLEEL